MAMNRRTVLSLAGGAIIVGGAGYLGLRSLAPPPRTRRCRVRGRAAHHP